MLVVGERPLIAARVEYATTTDLCCAGVQAFWGSATLLFPDVGFGRTRTLFRWDPDTTAYYAYRVPWKRAMGRPSAYDFSDVVVLRQTAPEKLMQRRRARRRELFGEDDDDNAIAG